jgi:superfamily II DNA or RNA helicase
MAAFTSINEPLRVLVVCGKLLEGFDYAPVSVVGILRNIAFTSKVLMNQFVGRAVRKASPDDPVSTIVVSHRRYNQRNVVEHFEDLPEFDPVEDPTIQ